MSERVQVTVSEDEPGADPRFLNADMMPMMLLLRDIVGAIIIDDPHIKMHGSQDRRGIYIDVEFGDPEKNCALFIGRRFRTVNAVLEIVRHQQLLRHNRFIELRLRKPDGTIQKVYNQRVYGRETHVQKIADLVSNMKISTSPAQQIEDLDRIVDTCIDYIEELENT